MTLAAIEDDVVSKYGPFCAKAGRTTSFRKQAEEHPSAVSPKAFR
jgi:hypothetical protein